MPPVPSPVATSGALPANSRSLPPVIPAEAGIQGTGTSPPHLDTRFRGYDGIGSVPSPTARDFRAKLPHPEIPIIWSRAALSPFFCKAPT
jgi:hypothetical protein